MRMRILDAGERALHEQNFLRDSIWQIECEGGNASGPAAGRQQKRNLFGRQSPGQPGEEATSEEPRPLSHDRHFSVSANSAHGYRPHVIADIIVFGGSGQIISVEHPGRRVEARRRKGAMLVPDATLSKGSAPLQFLWGTARSAPNPNGSRPEAVLEDHLEYKRLHHRVLENVGDIALQAFLRFLERQAPSAINWSTIVGHTRCNLAFRFQYDEHYLHERHAAQLAWKRFLTEGPTAAD